MANDDDDDNMDWDTDDEIWSASSSPVDSMFENSSVGPVTTSHLGISKEILEQIRAMGYSPDLINRAINETGTNVDIKQIVETIINLSDNSEASSSNSKMVTDLKAMGFAEEQVLKAIQDFGEDDIDVITNALLSYAEIDKLQRERENDDNNKDEETYSDLLSSYEENQANCSNEKSKLQELLDMLYSKDEALIAIERCGQNASLTDVIDFISAVQMSRQFDEEEDKIKKPRTYNEPLRRGRTSNTSSSHAHELIHLPNPMIGFGVPNEPGIMKQRPDPIPEVALGPPYFYYENVAMAPKGVWAKISSHLYGIKPEFVDSQFFCAAARKRGYIHNLPIENRFQIQPLPPYTIQEALPDTRAWWPSWDKRNKLNCLLTCIGAATTTGTIRQKLEQYEGEPPQHEQKFIIDLCKKWNLVWVGKNSVAPLEPDEMEQLLGYPKYHTRGGGITRTDRYKSLGNSFQVDTVAYHLSVLKPLFPNGLNVLSLFTGIGGGEVALHRLQIPMNVVVSVEISETNRNILKSFWVETSQKGKLIEIEDVQRLDRERIEQLMDQFGGFDLVIGGSPCNNLAGSNRATRNGLEGEQSSLFYDYVRILKAVREKAARMRR